MRIRSMFLILCYLSYINHVKEEIDPPERGRRLSSSEPNIGLHSRSSSSMSSCVSNRSPHNSIQNNLLYQSQLAEQPPIQIQSVPSLENVQRKSAWECSPTSSISTSAKDTNSDSFTSCNLFPDNSNGSINITSPRGPRAYSQVEVRRQLPVSLTAALSAQQVGFVDKSSYTESGTDSVSSSGTLYNAFHGASGSTATTSNTLSVPSTNTLVSSSQVNSSYIKKASLNVPTLERRSDVHEDIYLFYKAKERIQSARERVNEEHSQNIRYE
jgi:hypothetical protein